jgi:hypothetical protein
MTTTCLIVLSFIALVAASISIVRFMPSPERSPHAFDGQFHVTHDKDAQQLRILAANEDRLIVEETQGMWPIRAPFPLFRPNRETGDFRRTPPLWLQAVTVSLTFF